MKLMLTSSCSFSSPGLGCLEGLYAVASGLHHSNSVVSLVLTFCRGEGGVHPVQSERALGKITKAPTSGNF